MGKKKRGKSVRKNRAIHEKEPESFTRAPHTFVIHRGLIGKHIHALLSDFRRVMDPYTASDLKVKRKNTMKDFVSVAGLLHVSHMIVFTITETSPYLRVAHLPQGPTLTFKIVDYVLAKDVLSSLTKKYTHNKSFIEPPLIVLNGFSKQESHLNLISTMLQSMFPTINITNINLNNVKRCVLFNYNPETKLIEFRHYLIRVTPTGISRGIKKIVTGKVPNLAKYNDISEFVERGDLLSDMSEAEDEGAQVDLTQKITSKGNLIHNKSAIKLSEIGPRMTLQLIKVESNLMRGEVMYHEYIHKTEEEVSSIKHELLEKRKLKLKRRRQQELNVARKEKEKALMKEKSLEGMKRKSKSDEKALPEKKQRVEMRGNEHESGSEDDDLEWYRKEVGQEPEPELFGQQETVKRKGYKKWQNKKTVITSKLSEKDNIKKNFKNKKLEQKIHRHSAPRKKKARN